MTDQFRLSAATRQVHLLTVDSATVKRMAALIEVQTDAEITAKVGVGRQTWVKIRNGEPIRRSLALRLISRFQTNGCKGERQPHQSELKSQSQLQPQAQRDLTT